MDTYDSRVRKVTNGIINTIAGNGTYGFSGDGGSATSAELGYPWAAGYDAKGNLYILDAFNNRVRMVDTNGNISTVVGSGATGCGAGGYSGDGGPATSATLNCPLGLDVDAAGDLFISDYFNFVIRKVDANHTHHHHHRRYSRHSGLQRRRRSSDRRDHRICGPRFGERRRETYLFPTRATT